MKGRELPQWYLDEPEIPERSEFFLKAYRDLGTCRVMDGPIPWTTVQLYADQKSLDVDVANLLWEVIHRMDDTEREWHHANPPPKEPPRTGAGNGE